eukprot:744652-Rhodomonas_salina.1
MSGTDLAYAATRRLHSSALREGSAFLSAYGVIHDVRPRRIRETAGGGEGERKGGREGGSIPFYNLLAICYAVAMRSPVPT